MAPSSPFRQNAARGLRVLDGAETRGGPGGAKQTQTLTRLLTRSPIHSPPNTMGTFPAVLLHEYQPKSYAYLSFYPIEAPDKEPVKHIEQAVLTHVKSMTRFQRLKSLEVAKPAIYLVRRLCTQIIHTFISGSAVFGTSPGAVAAKAAG